MGEFKIGDVLYLEKTNELVLVEFVSNYYCLMDFGLNLKMITPFDLPHYNFIQIGSIE